MLFDLLIILFLFCSPDLDVLFGLDAPQPFVLIYQMALGKGGQMVMTCVAIIGLFIVRGLPFARRGRCNVSSQNTSLAITAASRLVFAVARDGILPGSKWIGKVDEKGQPRNAIIFIGVVRPPFFFTRVIAQAFGSLQIAGILLCTILPSTVAFTSLVSAGGVPTIAACEFRS